MAQLLRRKTSCFEVLCSGFTRVHSPDQGKTMNVPVFYLEVNTVLWALFTNV